MTKATESNLEKAERIQREIVYIQIAVVIGAITIGPMISYGLALIGEPRSHWIWHTLLGVI